MEDVQSKAITISIDIGNGYIKAINQQGDTLHYPTVVIRKKDMNYFNNMVTDYICSINDIEYYFGELALSKKGVRNWQNDMDLNADAEKHIALCCSLLTDNEPVDQYSVNVLLGLPFSAYDRRMRNNDKEIEKRLTDNKLKTVYDEVEKTFKINDVFVYPQGVGAYFSNLYDIQGNAINGAEESIDAIFIEVGYRTVDVIAFREENGKFALIDGFSLEESGMFRICQDICQKVNENGSEYTPNEIEYAIQNRNGKIANIYGTISLNEYEQEANNILSEQIAIAVNQRLSGELNKYSNIFISGGGAEKLFKPLKTMHFSQLQLQADPILANATGYLALNSINNNS